MSRWRNGFIIKHPQRKKGSKGITLVELLVATAVFGLLGAVTMPIVFQFIEGSARSSASATASNNMNSAAFWICRDGQMAYETDPVLVDGEAPVDIPGDWHYMTFAWTDLYEDAFEQHYSRFSLSDGDLIRDYDGSISTVAQGISNLSFSISDRTITVGITYSEGEISETKTYEIYMRPVE